LGRPGVGKTHLAVAIGCQAILTGYSVLFVSAPTLVAQLAKAHNEGRLEDRLIDFGKPRLLISDELGYLPFEPAAAHLFFQLAHRVQNRDGGGLHGRADEPPPICDKDDRGRSCLPMRIWLYGLVCRALLPGVYTVIEDRGPDWRRLRRRPASSMADVRRQVRLSCSNLMKPSMIFRWPRWAPILVVLAVATFAIVAICSLREPVLRAAGWALVANEPVAPADIIVLSLDSSGAGALEAADLVQSGISKRVAVFMDPPSGADHEFIRRGLPYEDAAARQIRQLKSLGVTDVVQISRVNGTEGEGQALPPWCDEHQLRSILVVATKDHSRRLRRVLDRVMKGHSTRVAVRPARYSSFDPDRWWETRDGVRTEIIELQKLLLDVVLHPMSL
jgi:hypothetical protein